MKPVLLLDVVGLTTSLLGTETPHLSALCAEGVCAPMTTVLPAVTASAQATMLTGVAPSQHGAVGNGWYFRELGEVFFWRQSNALVRGAKLYERARAIDPSFTCAKLFWWWNQGAAVDWTLTPKPFYPADGRKILAVYGRPAPFAEDMERELGGFPFLRFWGPGSGLPSSEWIARATARTLETVRPTLTLAYLPHLDYDLQRYGPDDERSHQALREVDELVGSLATTCRRLGVEILVVSEYGIESVDRPIHVNRALRRAGLLEVRPGPIGELLDVFASRAFAVSDHQVAHLYAADSDSAVEARRVVEELPGVARVLDADGKREHGIDHPRAGDLVAIAEKGSWFTYYYWMDDDAAPDFARTVDIHRKPGYDPCELFLDPGLRLPGLRIARRLAQKKLGFRYLMDVVPLDAGLVRGSHGRLPDSPDEGPVFLCSRPFDAEDAGTAGAGSGCGPAPPDGVVTMESVPERVLALLQRD